MFKMLRVALSIALIASSSLANAQQALVVAVCGTLSTPYQPGLLAYWTIDVNGKLCTHAGTLLSAPPPPPQNPQNEVQP